MDSLTLKEVLDKVAEKVKFDKRMALAVYQFQVGYVNKNQDTMAFFGGNLTGVHTLLFTDKEVSILFKEIFKMDPIAIKKGVSHCPAINEEFKVSSDILNITLMYCAHRFLTSEYLSTEMKKRAAIDTLLIFNYRTISAITNAWFRYPADQKVAHRTYERLSNKFLLKRLGTWQKVMNYRAESTVDATGIHLNTLTRFDDDFAVVYLINDSQRRVANMVKNIYAEFLEAHKSGDTISQTAGNVMGAEGEESFKDKTSGGETAVTYVFSTLSDRRTLVKKELVDVVLGVVPTAQKSLVEESLFWMVDKYLTNEKDLIERFIRDSIVQCYTYLEENDYVSKFKRDLGLILVKLKGMITSSRSTEPELMELRSMGYDIVRTATGRVNEQTVSAIRVSIILYLFLRAYTKSYFTN